MPDDKFESARKTAIRHHYLRPRERGTAANHARNVVGVGVAPKLTKGKPGEQCVRFYVERKSKSPDVIDEAYRIPKTLDGGVLTDVVETRRLVSFDGTAAPGADIGLDYSAPNVASSLTGALGAIVKIGDRWYALGSNHVMAVNGRVPRNTRILFKPPGKFIVDPNEYIFALLYTWVPLVPEGPEYDPKKSDDLKAANRVDCALAIVDKPDRVSGKFPDRTVNYAEIVDPKPNESVVRVGSGVKGTVEEVSARVRIDYRFGTFDFEDMVLIKSSVEGDNFATPGNSGDLVLNSNGMPTAMIVGGSQNYTIACKLSSVRDELQKTMPEDRRAGFDLLVEEMSERVKEASYSLADEFEKIKRFWKETFRP